MEKNRHEILEMMKKAKSWREFGLSIETVYQAFSSDLSPSSENERKVPAQLGTNVPAPVKESQEAENKVIKDLQEKIARLADTNKQLRAENKALRGGGMKKS